MIKNGKNQCKQTISL